MSQTIILKNPVRLLRKAFEEVTNKLLCQAQEVIPAGTRMEISEPFEMVYDHRRQWVVSTVIDAEVFYMILGELGNLSELTP